MPYPVPQDETFAISSNDVMGHNLRVLEHLKDSIFVKGRAILLCRIQFSIPFLVRLRERISKLLPDAIEIVVLKACLGACNQV